MDESKLAIDIAAKVANDTKFWIAIVGVICVVIGSLITYVITFLHHRSQEKHHKEFTKEQKEKNRTKTLKTINKTEDLAYNIKFITQMLIGISVFIILCKHFAIEFCEIISDDVNNEINLKHSLQVVSYGLGISAGIEMAYMLFTPGPDEAVEPIILSLASTLLFVLSSLEITTTNFIHFSVLVLSIGVLIAGLFYVKDKYIP